LLSRSLGDIERLARSAEVEIRGSRISKKGMDIVMKVISEEQIYREVLEDCQRDNQGRALGWFEWESPIEMVGYVRE